MVKKINVKKFCLLNELWTIFLVYKIFNFQLKEFHLIDQVYCYFLDYIFKFIMDFSKFIDLEYYLTNLFAKKANYFIYFV